MKILCICGSLRPKSYNLSLLRDIKTRLSQSADCKIYERLGDVPPFGPDLPCPDVIADLRSQIKTADAIIIASPEYVHGIPGVLKNALDWVVGSGEWDGKPTAIINVTPSANEPVYVRDGLKEVIRVMSGGFVLESASFTVTGAFKLFGEHGEITDPLLIEKIDQAVSVVKSIGNK